MKKKFSPVPLIAIILGIGLFISSIPLVEAQSENEPTCKELLEKILDAMVKAGRITEEEKEAILANSCSIIF